MASIEEQLVVSGIVLPDPITPIGNYASAVRWGQLLFLSGHISRREGKPVLGRFGDNLTYEQGYELARLVALDLLSTIQENIGSLDGVSHIIKLTGMVNSTPTFIQQAAVINGASDFLVGLWGDNGKHTRSAFSVAALPLGAALEIELVCALKDGI